MKKKTKRILITTSVIISAIIVISVVKLAMGIYRMGHGETRYETTHYSDGYARTRLTNTNGQDYFYYSNNAVYMWNLTDNKETKISDEQENVVNFYSDKDKLCYDGYDGYKTYNLKSKEINVNEHGGKYRQYYIKINGNIVDKSLEINMNLTNSEKFAAGDRGEYYKLIYENYDIWGYYYYGGNEISVFSENHERVYDSEDAPLIIYADNNKIICDNGSYTFDVIENGVYTKNGIDLSEFKCDFSPDNIINKDNKLYLLGQKGDSYRNNIHYNRNEEAQEEDFLITVDLDNYEISKLYSCKKKDGRIVGYKDRNVYIYLNGKISEYNLDSEEKRECGTLKPNKYMRFEMCGDYIFVFTNEDNLELLDKIKIKE